MGNPQDRPAREPGRGATATGNTAAENTASVQDTRGAGSGRPADAPRQYVPRPATGYDDMSHAKARWALLSPRREWA